MKKNSKHLDGLISAKLIFIFLAGMLFFSGYQSSPVRSQAEPGTSPGKDMNKQKDLESLEDLTWQNRIILVREEEEEVGNAGLRKLQESSVGLNERDVVWFRLSNGALETNYRSGLSKDLAGHLEKNYFEKFNSNVLLIGKDGSVKSKDERLDLEYYFKLIDSMPMRQREMSEQ